MSGNLALYCFAALRCLPPTTCCHPDPSSDPSSDTTTEAVPHALVAASNHFTGHVRVIEGRCATHITPAPPASCQ
jgi:hypothetical protein